MAEPLKEMFHAAYFTRLAKETEAVFPKFKRTAFLKEVQHGNEARELNARMRHASPFPDEIKAIRAKYDLSAIKMSEVLGFGANVWRNYEAGEVPSESNARLIQVADDPMEFGKMVRLTAHLDEKTKEKIIARIDTLLRANHAGNGSTELHFYSVR